MKNLLITIATSLSLLFVVPSISAETKQVCVDTKDKNGKEVKQCKKIKVHEKLDGTKVPDAKK